MNTDNQNLITAFAVFFIAITFFIWYINRKRYKNTECDNTDEEREKFTISKLITIRIENKTQEELSLNLFNLDVNDSRYKVHCSCDYKMLSEYSKTNLFYANHLRTVFKNRNSFLKIATLNKFNPYSPIPEETPLVVPINDYKKEQYQANIIDTEFNFEWHYFNDINVKVIGNEDYTMSIFVSEEQADIINNYDLLFGLILSNNTSEVKQIKLLNPDYWKENKDNKEVNIESYLPTQPYKSILETIEKNEFYHITKMKLFSYEGNGFDSEVTLNHTNFKINDYKTENQFQSDVIDIDFGRKIPSANFYIELQPKSKIVMLLK